MDHKYRVAELPTSSDEIRKIFADATSLGADFTRVNDITAYFDIDSEPHSPFCKFSGLVRGMVSFHKLLERKWCNCWNVSNGTALNSYARAVSWALTDPEPPPPFRSFGEAFTAFGMQSPESDIPTGGIGALEPILDRRRDKVINHARRCVLEQADNLRAFAQKEHLNKAALPVDEEPFVNVLSALSRPSTESLREEFEKLMERANKMILEDSRMILVHLSSCGFDWFQTEVYSALYGVSGGFLVLPMAFYPYMSRRAGRLRLSVVEKVPSHEVLEVAGTLQSDSAVGKASPYEKLDEALKAASKL